MDKVKISKQLLKLAKLLTANEMKNLGVAKFLEDKNNKTYCEIEFTVNDDITNDEFNQAWNKIKGYMKLMNHVEESLGKLVTFYTENDKNIDYVKKNLEVDGWTVETENVRWE